MNESQLSQNEKIQLFMSLFRGRDDCYGEGSGQCTKEILDDTVIKNHLSGKKRIGIYMLVGNNGDKKKDKIYFAVMDFDNPDDAPKESSRLDDALDYINVCKSYGLSACLEKSKTDGSFHVWHFFSEPISALKIRRLMMQIVSDTNIKRYEIFPKQDSTESFGNYVNLPLFKANLPTNTAFLDDFNQPYTDQWSYIQQISQSIKNSPENIDDIIEINNIKLSINGNKAQDSEEPKEKWLTNALDGVSDGKRTTTLVKLVGYWASKNMPNDVIMSTAIIWDKGNKPPLIDTDGRELFTKTVLDVINRYHNGGVMEDDTATETKVSESSEEKEIEFFKCTDYGNAERLVYYYGDVIRYCHQMKSWLVWDGTRWKTDTNGQIIRLAKDTVRKIYTEAGKIDDDEIRKSVGKHAKSSESSNKIQAMVTLAQSENGVSIETGNLDGDLWLLNCQNGTIDLRTGELLAHTKSHNITKIIPVKYDKMAECPRWELFLREVFDDDKDLIRFIKYAVGYSLTGIIKEHCLFICYGKGRNGKSVMLDTLEYLMGDYSKNVQPETFEMQNKVGGTASEDIARLKDARFISTTESAEGRRLSEGLIKKMTGDRMITARPLYQDSFQFMQTYKIWFGTNHKPVINENNNAMWDRIKLIPFEVYFPPEKRDMNLLEKLMDESAGILNWAIEGCLVWQKTGLLSAQSDKISNATNEYKVEMDILGDFINNHCNLGKDLVVSKQMLYNEYEEWCKNNGIKYPDTKIKFGKKLKESYTVEGKNGTDNEKFWTGIAIKYANMG